MWLTAFKSNSWLVIWCSYVNVAILVYVFIADHGGNFRTKFPNNIAWFLAGFTSSEQWVDLKISEVFVINQWRAGDNVFIFHSHGIRFLFVSYGEAFRLVNDYGKLETNKGLRHYFIWEEFLNLNEIVIQTAVHNFTKKLNLSKPEIQREGWWLWVMLAKDSIEISQGLSLYDCAATIQMTSITDNR